MVMERFGHTCSQRVHPTQSSVLRASGVPYDVRKDAPYLVYDKLNFDIPISRGKDVLSRFIVRFEEMRQSVKIVQQALDKIPDGPYFNPKAKKSLMIRLRGEGDVIK